LENVQHSKREGRRRNGFPAVKWEKKNGNLVKGSVRKETSLQIGRGEGSHKQKREYGGECLRGKVKRSKVIGEKESSWEERDRKGALLMGKGRKGGQKTHLERKGKGKRGA